MLYGARECAAAMKPDFVDRISPVRWAGCGFRSIQGSRGCVRVAAQDGPFVFRAVTEARENRMMRGA